MPFMECERIAAEGTISLFLTEMRGDIYPYRNSLPNRERYTKIANEWRDIQHRLHRSLFQEFENEVMTAFIDFERLNSECFWTMGLIDAVNHHIQDMGVIETETDLLDPSGVEFRLNQVCENFIGRLDEKYRAKCAEYFQVWKEWECSGRYLYYRHGVEFAQSLLGRMVPQCDSDGA